LALHVGIGTVILIGLVLIGIGFGKACDRAHFYPDAFYAWIFVKLGC
jgi:hypothetical protein